MALSNSISNIFGVSPIKPIQNHMAEVINCVSKLEDFLVELENHKMVQHPLSCTHSLTRLLSPFSPPTKLGKRYKTASSTWVA